MAKEPRIVPKLLKEIKFKESQIQHLKGDLDELIRENKDLSDELYCIKSNPYNPYNNEEEDYEDDHKDDHKDDHEDNYDDKEYIYVNLDEFINSQNGKYTKKEIDEYRLVEELNSRMYNKSDIE